MPRIKKLTWQADKGPSIRAKTVQAWWAEPHTGGWNYQIKVGKTFRLFLSGAAIGRYFTLGEATAAAQADYERRILAALEDEDDAEKIVD